MDIQQLRERDLECDECSRCATHSVDLELQGGKKDRKFFCTTHLNEFKSEHAPLAKPGTSAMDYAAASRGI